MLSVLKKRVAIRSILNESPATKGPRRLILAGGNIFCGLMPLVAVPFILLGTSIPAIAVPHEEGSFIPLVIGLGLSAILVLLAILSFWRVGGCSKIAVGGRWRRLWLRC